MPICLVAAALLAFAGAAFAQTPPASPDSAAAPAAAPVAPAPVTPEPVTPPPAPAPAPTQKAAIENPVYYGGAVGFSFWNDYWRISLEPYAARKLNPKLSVGGKVRYEYLNDSRGLVDYDSHNFGASVFSNFRVTQQFYGHGEFAYMSYDYPGGRELVPFLLLGGGISQMIRPNVWSTVEVLWDVINDKNSPYDSGEPQITVGVGVGF